jgi:hypothetical protein
VLISCPGTASLGSLGAITFTTEGNIYIRQGNIVFGSSLTIDPIYGGSGKTDFFCLCEEQQDCVFCVSFEVANNPAVQTIIFIKTLFITTFIYIRSVLAVLFNPRYLDWLRRDQLKRK